jgi:hypothetical protein
MTTVVALSGCHAALSFEYGGSFLKYAFDVWEICRVGSDKVYTLGLWFLITSSTAFSLVIFCTA